MIVWLLIVTIGQEPLGSQFETREACEDAALRVRSELGSKYKIECVERKARSK